MLIFLLQILVPYLRAKAHDYYESIGGGVDLELVGDHVYERRPRVEPSDVSGYLCLDR